MLPHLNVVDGTISTLFKLTNCIDHHTFRVCLIDTRTAGCPRTPTPTVSFFTGSIVDVLPSRPDLLSCHPPYRATVDLTVHDPLFYSAQHGCDNGHHHIRIGSFGGIRTHTERILSPLTLPVGLRSRIGPGARNRTEPRG